MKGKSRLHAERLHEITMNKPSESTIDSARQKRYLSARELAIRWSCSRTSAQRIADGHGLRRFYLGEGRNGMVRYALDEIVQYEESRAAKS